MCNVCDDNRFKLIEKYKTQLIEATNIADSPEEMAVLDTIFFRFWQMDWLDKLEKPAQQWIPCSERLPEEHEDVLLCIKDWKSQKTKMIVSSRRDYNYWDGLGREISGDIAWMPLPEPYKGENE